jgi:hypothetical protein
MGALAVYFEISFQHFSGMGVENIDDSGSGHLPFVLRINPPSSKHEAGVRTTENQRFWLPICDLGPLTGRLSCY